MIAVVVFISYLMWSSGSSGLDTLVTILGTGWDLLMAFVGFWNDPISPTLPLLMTIVNVFFDLTKLFIGGVLGLACTKLPFVDPDFIAEVHCATLWDWISIVPGIAKIISESVKFITDFVDLARFALFPGVCLIDEQCKNMCQDLGLDSGCYNTGNAIKWIFASDSNFWEFIINNFDFFLFRWAIPIIGWLAEEVGTLPLAYHCPTSCYNSQTQYNNCIGNGDCTKVDSLYYMLTIIADSQFKIISHFFIAILIHYVFSPAATILCIGVLNIVGCLSDIICRSFLGPFEYLCDIITETCQCLRPECINGLMYPSVCSLALTCLSCDPYYSVLILWIVDIADNLLSESINLIN